MQDSVVQPAQVPHRAVSSSQQKKQHRSPMDFLWISYGLDVLSHLGARGGPALGPENARQETTKPNDKKSFLESQK